MANLSHAVYQLVSIIMSLLVTAGICGAPSTSAPINKSESNVLLSFAAFGDSQVANYNIEREEYLVSAAKDISNSETAVDALVIAGDVTENGFQSEYDLIKDDISDIGVENYIFAAGNHDIRLREYEQSTSRFLTFLNDLNAPENAQNSIYYSYDVNGYKFIVIGSDEMRFEDAYISDAQLKWLDNQLKEATASGSPAFVIGHYPFNKSHGLPITWSNSLWESGGLGEQSDAVYEILNKYQNVFYITGHLHTGFGQYTFEKIGNINSINLPSLGIENKDGDYNNQGIGFLVEVTSSKVNFRARNFATGEFLSQYDITVGLE